MIEVLPPADVYLDTAAFVGAIVPGAPHATACLEFWAQLIRYRSRVYYSRVLWLELPHALRGLATKPRQVDAPTRQRYRLDTWGADPAVRERGSTMGLVRWTSFWTAVPRPPSCRTPAKCGSGQ